MAKALASFLDELLIEGDPEPKEFGLCELITKVPGIYQMKIIYSYKEARAPCLYRVFATYLFTMPNGLHLPPVQAHSITDARDYLLKWVKSEVHVISGSNFYQSRGDKCPLPLPIIGEKPLGVCGPSFKTYLTYVKQRVLTWDDPANLVDPIPEGVHVDGCECGMPRAPSTTECTCKAIKYLSYYIGRNDATIMWLVQTLDSKVTIPLKHIRGDLFRL